MPASTAPVKKTSKPVAVILTLLLSLIVLFPLFTWIRSGWFLPEPQYSAGSYQEVLNQEILQSLKNLFINIAVLSVGFALTFWVFLSAIFNLSKFKIILICFLLGLISGTAIVSLDIIKSISHWRVLEGATLGFEQKSYGRGRGGGLGLQKEYSITFVNPSNTADSVKNVLVPSLQKSGFTIHPQATGQEMVNKLDLGQDFVITPENRNYLSLNFTKPNPKRFIPQSIHFLLGYNSLFSKDSADLVKKGTTEGFIRLFPND